MAKNRCKQCGVDSGNYRICETCYQASFRPCTDCGNPTPTITKFGKPTKNTTCKPCTSRNTADTRRIGKTCLVCGKRFKSEFHANKKSVCDECMKSVANCPCCGNEMQKYKEKGGERKYCSAECVAKSVPIDIRSKASKKANKTKWKDHVYKSKQNKIARSNSEFKQWREAVFRRDNYTCQLCGTHGGHLHPHHIKPFATYIDLRYEPSNGITLCKSCHLLQHSHIFIGRGAYRISGK